LMYQSGAVRSINDRFVRKANRRVVAEPE
jgi:hypothetical protein